MKSCITTRAGVKAISLLGAALASHVASASMSSAVTAPLPSVRSRFSSRIFSENGSRATSNFACSASSRKISRSRPPALSVALASKLLVDIRAFSAPSRVGLLGCRRRPAWLPILSRRVGRQQDEGLAGGGREGPEVAVIEGGDRGARVGPASATSEASTRPTRGADGGRSRASRRARRPTSGRCRRRARGRSRAQHGASRPPRVAGPRGPSRPAPAASSPARRRVARSRLAPPSWSARSAS